MPQNIKRVSICNLVFYTVYSRNMQRRNTEIFFILIGVSSYVNLSSSFPGDFNFNGNIQKVNNLSFNSYFYGRGQSSVSNPEDHPSSKTPKSSTLKSSERDDSSDGEYKGKDIGGARGYTEIPGATSGFTLTDEEEQSILYSGVSVDYSFNETVAVGDDPNKQISAPGCPASGEKDDRESYLFSNRSIWVHHGSPPRCYLLGSQGPCRAGMSLGLQSNSFVGKCKCKCFVEFTVLKYLQTIQRHNLPNLDPFLDEKQSFCFDYDEAHFALYQDECHMLLTQGPCKNNEAFVLNRMTNQPSCEVRECLQAETRQYESLRFGYAIKHNGICSNLRQQCVNVTSKGVNSNDILESTYFVGTKVDNPMPTCVTQDEGVEFGASPLSYENGLEPSECTQNDQYFSKILRRCFPYNSRGRSGAVG